MTHELPDPSGFSQRLSHLRQLEAESIHIIREVAAEFDRPVMLYSIGKDSSVMVHLARKAFAPAKLPFPLLHIDTTWKFREMIEFRDRFCRDHGLELVVHTNQRGVQNHINPFDHGSNKYTAIMKTQALLQALAEGGYDAAFGGARRDEEKSRAKERIYSFRDRYGQWDPKNQRPELWNLYNGKLTKGESIRAFPLSNWTELDIWLYVYLEQIIPIDARLGVLDQSRRHAYIAALLGIPNLAVCVNKMDLVNFDEATFERIRAEFGRFAASLGFRDVKFVPISALAGDNCVHASNNMPWYRDGTLLDYLENVPVTSQYNFDDFRFPVQYVLRPHLNYRGFAASVASGIVRKGDRVQVLPSGKQSRVLAIDTFEGEVAAAFPPMSVTLRLEDEIDISRGDVLVHPHNLPETDQRLEPMLVWMSETALDRSQTYFLKHTTQLVRAGIETIDFTVDLETLEQLPANRLELNDIAGVTLTCQKSLYYDAYRKNRITGSFILIDPISNNTVAAGMISGPASTLDRENAPGGGAARAKPHSQISADERSERLGQRGVAVWLTGLPCSGKTEIAYALERRLFDQQRFALVVDPDDGLSRNARSDGSSPEQMPEFAQRAAEAGIITIFAYASPLRADRAALRDAVGPARFLEVHVSTPLEVCKQPRYARGVRSEPTGPELRKATRSGAVGVPGRARLERGRRQDLQPLGPEGPAPFSIFSLMKSFRLSHGVILGLALAACATHPPAPSAPPPPAPATPPATTAGANTEVPPAASAVAAPAEQSKPPALQGSQAERASICAGGEYAALPVQETKASLVKDGFVFVEGPVWSDQLGSLLFSEMDFTADGSNGPPSKIHLLTPERQLHTFLDNSGSNGLAIDGKGLVAATHAPQALTRIDLATKQRTSIIDAVGGKKFNSPNDLVISRAGHVYFTDPDWQLGKRANETGMTGVYWVKPDGAIALVDGKLDKPNGVSLSPDDKTLYVGTLDDSVWAYSIDAGGKPTKRRLFASVDGPDGMAMDCAGNLYVTSHGPGTVEVFDRTGKKLTSIGVAPKTTNAAFGGQDRKTLYVTAGTGVYALPTVVPGFPY